ncbi:MAG: homoserine dehydrogenase [Chloroflexi bacterium]|nr:homoserine dehydrogenase [Chloroflexota bacterium]
MGKRESIGIGLMGLGVIGGGVAKALMEREEAIASQVGCPLRLRKILVRDLAKRRVVEVEPHLLTTDPRQIIDDPEIDIVIEVIGGESPALELIKEAILKGKHVVTANKEVISKHGPELISLAQTKGVDILYEASVGGGIPLIAPFKQDLLANKISAIYAIINGTTNYILTRMASEGLDFSSALKQAQKMGYAEPDPTNDIEGIDAAYKLAILATLAFHTVVRPQDVYHEGISRLSSRDFRYARELGYAIKLLAIAKEKDASIEVRVHPVFIPEDLLLAKVEGVYNAVQVEGDLVGRVMFYGQGAGAFPTSSAVIADVIDLGQRINLGVSITSSLRLDPGKRIKPISEIETRYYLRLSTVDRPGVLAQISKILGDLQISISSVIQRETDVATGSAQIVLMSYPAQEWAMQRALKEIERLEVVKEISNFIRVED